MSNLFLAVLGLCVLLPSTAYAYIDPGSGSVVMSAIIGFFVAAGLIIKTYFYKIVSLFRPSAKRGENKQ